MTAFGIGSHLTRAGIKQRFCSEAAVVRPVDLAGPDAVLPLVVIGYKTTTANKGVVRFEDAMRNAETICPERFYRRKDPPNVFCPLEEGTAVQAAVAAWGTDGILRLDIQLPFCNPQSGPRLQLVGPNETGPGGSARVRQPRGTHGRRIDIKIIVDAENLHFLVGKTIADAICGPYTADKAGDTRR